MSTDADLTYTPRGQQPVTVKLKGKLKPGDWAQFHDEYRKLAQRYGLRVVARAVKKRPSKKKAVAKKAAKSKSK